DSSFVGTWFEDCDCVLRFLVPVENGKFLVWAESSLQRFSVDGSPDTSFTPVHANAYGISAMTVQEDGRILIGGTFTNINGASRRGLARLNADGSLDNTFAPGVSWPLSGCGGGVGVLSVALQSDGKILIGGGFTNVGGFTRKGLARLDPDGSVDA